jgi:membrane-bound inhibitor of C-type lysozyme
LHRLSPLLLLLLATGCAQQLPKVSETTWQCADGTRFTARGGGKEITLTFPHHTLTLPRVRSGSGEKYTNRRLLYWNKGNEVILSTGHSMLRCHPLLTD